MNTYVDWAGSRVKLSWRKSQCLPPIEKITSVHGLCFKNDDFLLVDLPHRGWDFPGGHREKDETPEECIKREAMEEAYVEGQITQIGYIIVDHSENKNWSEDSQYPKVGYQVFYRMDVQTLHPFQGFYESNQRIFIHPSEVREYYSKWTDFYEMILREGIELKPQNRLEEVLSIFDDDGRKIGVENRSEVHSKGYWHETFHCWLGNYDKERDLIHIYFQLRSDKKKDFPSLLDITAAGHILSKEKIEDGVREVEEELGLKVSIQELVSLGVIKEELSQPSFIDREIAHVFLYPNAPSFDDFDIENDEVSGIFMATLDDFEQLVLRHKKKISIEGFVLNNQGKKESVKKEISLEDFVPHNSEYFFEVIKRITRC